MIAIMRHGEYKKILWGDGPLTEKGSLDIQISTKALAEELKSKSTTIKVIVSGSLRDTDTWLKVAPILAEGIYVSEWVIDSNLFATAEEAVAWVDVKKDPNFKTDEVAIGHAQAILKHARPLVEACVDRIVGLVGAEDTLIITHTPHDIVIGEKLEKHNQGLKMGKFIIL